jgi:hypothetical protein
MNLPVHEVDRLMDRDEASALVGALVPEMEPNAGDPGIWVDRATGDPVLVVLALPRTTTAPLRRAVLTVKYGVTTRQTTGLNNRSRTFGMAPRKVYQMREACRPAALASEQPDVHDVLVRTALELEGALRELAPGVWDEGEHTMEQVADEWRIAEGSVWTSGVINKTSTLPYHRDGFNFDVWSAMPVLRRAVAGGNLHFPEWGLTSASRDGTALFFNGFRNVHGVTPLAMRAEDGYRFTIVYYSLRGMKDCFTYAVEQARAQAKRTEREDGIAAAVRGEGGYRVWGDE